MMADPDENARDYLRRALEHHCEQSGESLGAVAARAGFSIAYLESLTRAGGVDLPLSQIMPLCEAVPALLPHELLYLRLREKDAAGALQPADLTALREDYDRRKREGALQRGESTSYEVWRRRFGNGVRPEDAAR